MVRAEPAGLPESLTSLTQSTDDEDDAPCRFGYAFTVKYTDEGLIIERWCDVSTLIGASWVGILAAEKLTGVQNLDDRVLIRQVSMLDLRMRFDGAVRGPYCIKTQEPFTQIQMENLLRTMSQSRRKAFLERAKI